jgi:hypothetical protein
MSSLIAKRIFIFITLLFTFSLWLVVCKTQKMNPYQPMASVFVNHGGGPYPLLAKEEYKAMYEQF